jgi:tetratricopeptide (TPR) repeat protein
LGHVNSNIIGNPCVNYRIQLLLITIGIIVFSCHKPTQSISTSSGEDYTLRGIDSLNRKSEELRKSSPDSALLIARKTLQLSQENNYLKGVGNSLNYIGIAFFYLSEYDSSMVYNERALNIFKNLKDSIRYNEVLISIGNIFQNRGMYIESAKYFEKAYNSFISLGYNKTISGLMTNISSSYFQQANYKKALDFSLKALTIAITERDLTCQANSYYTIGMIYYQLGEYDKANENYDKATKIYTVLNDNASIGAIYDLQALIYISENKMDSAIKFYEKSLSIASGTKYLSFQANIKNNMGDWYYRNAKYDQALKYFSSAKELYGHLKDNSGLSLTMIGLGMTYMKLNQLEQARNNIIQGYNLSNSIIDPDLKKQASKALSDLFEEENDYKNALVYYKIYKNMADSVLNRSNIEKVTSVQMQYEFDIEQKQLENIQIQKDLEHKLEIKQVKARRLLILLISIAIITSLSITFLLYRNRQKSKIDRLKVDINKNMQRLLGQQMNPHFIFNTLKSIQNFILNNDVKQSNLFLTRFAGLIRRTLENSQSEFVSLTNEMESLELYAQLENLRLNDKFIFLVKIDNQINPDLTKVPSLFFQPYIENAIWHGVSGIEGKGEINLTILLETDRLLCTVEDNGEGRQKSNPEEKVKHKSLGTSITERRILLLNSLYHTNIRPEISDRIDLNGNPKGTRVYFTLPYIN